MRWKWSPGVCDRVLLFDRGELVFDGDPAAGVDRYYQLFFKAPAQPALDTSLEELRYGSGGAKIGRSFASLDGVSEALSFKRGERVTIVMEVEFERAVAMPHFGFSCSTKEGIRVYATTTPLLGESPAPASAGERRRVEIAFELTVAVGDLFIDLSVFEFDQGSYSVLDARLGVLHLAVTSLSYCAGVVDLDAGFAESILRRGDGDAGVVGSGRRQTSRPREPDRWLFEIRRRCCVKSTATRVGPVYFQPLEQELGPVAQYLSGHLLNAGCGSRDVSSYLARERCHEDYELRHCLAQSRRRRRPLESMPFADGTFDSVLCNAVLEHVPNAEESIRELARVVKPNGHVVVAVPFLQPFHACPADFRRYTADGLAALGVRAGLDVVCVLPVHSITQTLGWILWEYAQEKGGRLRRWAAWVIAFLATRLWNRTDQTVVRNANTFQAVFRRPPQVCFPECMALA